MNIMLTADPTTTAGGSAIVMILVYVAFFAILYLLFMRPQKKEQKRVTAMLANLENGDCVLTTSGFYGVVIDITDDTVIVEFGNNKNCRIPMQKSAIVRTEKPEM
jgi:preprotein translocase subunit YajC